MKRLAVFAAAALLTSSPALADTTTAPDPEHLRLAGRLVVDFAPEWISGAWLVATGDASAKFAVAAVAWSRPLDTAASARPLPRALDLRQLHDSLERGAVETAPWMKDQMAEAYAQAVDADALRAAVAFYEQPQERAVLARRQTLLTKLMAVASLDPTDPQGSAAAAHQRDDLTRRLSAKTPEELAFGDTPAGKALTAADPTIGKVITAAATARWARILAIAEPDYCARRVCAEDDRKQFEVLAHLFEASPPVADASLPANH